MVGDHGFHLREADALEPNPRYDLLVREGEKQLAGDFGF